MEVDVEDMEADVLLRRCHHKPSFRLQSTYQDVTTVHVTRQLVTKKSHDVLQELHARPLVTE